MSETKLKTRREDLVYPELSYVIVGCAFEVFNEIGPGHMELYYQKALALLFVLTKRFRYLQIHPLELHHLVRCKV